MERLNLYRKIAKANTIEEIEDWRSGEDRFGPFPSEATRYFYAKGFNTMLPTYFVKITLRVGKMWWRAKVVVLGTLIMKSVTNILNHIKKVAGDSHTIIQKMMQYAFYLKK